MECDEKMQEVKSCPRRCEGDFVATASSTEVPFEHCGNSLDIVGLLRSRFETVTEVL